MAVVAVTLPWLLVTHTAPAGADTADQVQACPSGATNDQFNCMRYPYPVQKVTAELMPDGTFSWVAGSDNTTLPTCPNFVQPADVPCQQFGPNQVRVFEGASSSTKVLPLVPGTGQVSLYGAGYSSQFEWAGKACGTFECRYWVRPSSSAFSDGQDRVLMMEYQTYIRATYDSSGITSTYRNLLVSIPRPLQDPFANATYSATGNPGEWRLDASTSTAVAPANLTDWEWTIPGVGTKHGEVVDAVIPRAQLPATVTLKVTDSAARSTTTTMTVDDSIAIQTVDYEPDAPVVGAYPAVATVTLKNQGAWPVTGATVTMTSATPSLITVAGGPTPASRTLNPGASGTFTIPLDAVARGQATIKTSATAVDGTRTLADGPKDGLVTVKAPAVQAVLEADAGARTSGQPFDVRAVVTNTGDTTLTDVRPDGALGATGIDGISVTGPTPASTASLAPNASTTFTYRVTSPPGAAHFTFRAKATDPDAGPITGNDAQLDKQVVDGLRITSVTGEHSGQAYATAKGGEGITLKGAGFSNVTEVVLDDGTDDPIIEAVAPVDDRTIEFSSPDVADRLVHLEDGSDRYLVDVIARYEDPDHPGEYIESAPEPFSFQAPIITAIVGERSGEEGIAGARGGETLSINGSGFTDVTSVAMFTTGTADQTVTIQDVTVVSDELMTITSPDVTGLLERSETDATLRYDVDVFTGYEAASIGNQVVQSNPWPFQFVGPSITSVTAERSGRNIGAIKGGETLTVKGFELDDVTELSFRQAGTTDVLATADVTVVDDTTLTVTSPNMTEFITYGADDEPGGVNADVFATVEPDDGDPYTSNPLLFDFQGPSITSVTSERGGEITGAVAGDTLTIEGTGLTDVTEIALYRTGTDDVLTTIDVADATEATETEITVATPNLAAYLRLDDDLLTRVKTDVVAQFIATGAPGGKVTSQSLRMDFTPPQLAAVDGERSGTNADTAKGGVNTLNLAGSMLKDADRIGIFQAGTTDLLVSIPVEPEDDGLLTIDSPSMTKYLAEFPDDQGRVETEIVAVDDDAPTTGGSATSQPIRFDFLAPRIDGLSAERGVENEGPAAGGDTWNIDGRGFTDVTGFAFYRTGTDDLLTTVDASASSDTEAQITSPVLERYLLPQSDGIDRAKVDVRAVYDDEDATDGVVASNPLRYDFLPPVLDRATSAVVRDAGVLDITIEGDFLTEVTFAGYRDPEDEARLVDIPVQVLDEHHVTLSVPPLSRYLLQRPDGTWARDFELFVGYVTDQTASGTVQSNPQPLQLTADALTRVSQASPAGATEVEVASNEGWATGQYAVIEAPGGAVVRRVAGIGSLIFDAPVPVALPVGTFIRQIDPPDGDTTAPTVTSTGAHQLTVGQTATVAFACADSGVGVEACRGSVAAGTAIDTSAVGTTTVTVQTWDRNGNAATEELTWTVTDGAEPPPTTTTTSTTTTTTTTSPTTTTSSAAGSTVIDGGTASGTLPRTGSSTGSAVQTGLLLVLAGFFTLIGSRRLRRT